MPPWYSRGDSGMEAGTKIRDGTSKRTEEGREREGREGEERGGEAANFISAEPWPNWNSTAEIPECLCLFQVQTTTTLV